MIKLFLALLMCLSLAGCTNEPKNDYIGNLKVDYSLIVNDQKVDQSLFEFYYGYSLNAYINQLTAFFGSDLDGILPFAIGEDINGLHDQTCTIEGYEDQSWAYYFASQALNHYIEMEGIYQKATNEGFVLTEEMKANAKTNYENLQVYCTESDIDEEDYLHSLFGLKATKDFILIQYEKLELVSSYITNVKNNVSEDDIEAYYKNNSDEIDLVTIRYFAFSKDEAGLKKAADMAMNIKSEKDFQKQAINFSDDAYKVYYEATDLTLRQNLEKASLPSYLQEVVYNQMNLGEVKVVEGDNSYDVVMLVSREKPDYNTVHISTIYLDARESDDATLTQEKLDVCRLFATSLLEKIQNETDATLDTFHTYNTMYADDKTNQGDYNYVTKQQCTPDIAQWIYAENRQYGDMAVLKSTYGYSIVFFREQASKAYLMASEEKLREEKYQQLLTEIHETYVGKIQ